MFLEFSLHYESWTNTESRTTTPASVLMETSLSMPASVCYLDSSACLSVFFEPKSTVLGRWSWNKVLLISNVLAKKKPNSIVRFDLNHLTSVLKVRWRGHLCQTRQEKQIFAILFLIIETGILLESSKASFLFTVVRWWSLPLFVTCTVSNASFSTVCSRRHHHQLELTVALVVVLAQIEFNSSAFSECAAQDLVLLTQISGYFQTLCDNHF